MSRSVATTKPPDTAHDDSDVPSLGSSEGKSSPMPVSAVLDTCVICLSPLTARAVTYPCNHLVFDLHCLTAWLRHHRPDCPLCNTPVQRVEYDWRTPTEHKTWHVPPRGTPRRRQQQRGDQRRPRSLSDPDDSLPPPPVSPALARRKRIHARSLRSLHRAPVAAPLTPSRFRASTVLQRRARLFLRRELQVFDDFLDTARRREWVLEYIVQMVAKLEVKGADGGMEGLVAEVLGSRGPAGVLCHELRAWLEADAGTLEEWDAVAQYADVEVMRMVPNIVFEGRK